MRYRYGQKGTMHITPREDRDRKRKEEIPKTSVIGEIKVGPTGKEIKQIKPNVNPFISATARHISYLFVSLTHIGFKNVIMLNQSCNVR